MTQEDRELLLKDLCARLPYGVKIYTKDGKNDTSFILKISDLNWIFKDNRIDEMYEYDGWKPYLRPMSSMTKEEKKELGNFATASMFASQNKDPLAQLTREALLGDFFNKHHFDYRGLIPMGLALEVTKENNPYK